MKFFRIIVVGIFLLLGFISPRVVFAATTQFRSAHITTTDGAVPYTNLANCSATDGATCDRAIGASFGNLYFRDFGTYADFGIPDGSKIAQIRIRVTGKTTAAIFVGLSAGQTFSSNCQFPSDLWTLSQLTSQILSTQTFVAPLSVQFQPGTVASTCLQQFNVDNANFIWRINYSAAQSWSANIDNFEIAFDYDPQPTPTPSPTLTPTPTPTVIPTPEPFLDLPWDYEGKGMTFNEAALSITSFFDHEYPLLSSGTSEPQGLQDTIIKFSGVKNQDQYSSHDGYDYAKKANVNIGDPVLAAASGTARYINSCASCGDMIIIDHGNGYQTRYMHMQKNGLVATDSAHPVQVDMHQQIGKVGATGNVSPSGDEGAHIHFGVFQDKNGDGNFDDNVPDGVTDPFGWQSKDPDPWANYIFGNKTGNKSYYLWMKRLDNLDATLPANGGVFASGKTTVAFPSGATNQNLNLQMITEPLTKLSNILQSLGSTINITLQTPAGTPVTSLLQPMALTINFSALDLSPFNQGTLSIYSSSDGTKWTKENTIIDLLQRTATTEVNHLTHFALAGELADTIAPVTVPTLSGLQGQPNKFHSDVSLTLTATDNADGLGVDYILYRADGSDWDTYTTPLTFASEGHHGADFYAVDKAGNIEDAKIVSFDIDKTPPEAALQYDASLLDMKITGIDSSGSATVTQTNSSKLQPVYQIQDLAGNVLQLKTGKILLAGQLAFSLNSLQYNASPASVLDKNVYGVLILLNANKSVRQLDQFFAVKDDKKIIMSYDGKTQQTTISVKPSGSSAYTKSVKSGLDLLQLTTQQGILKYSY